MPRESRWRKQLIKAVKWAVWLPGRRFQAGALDVLEGVLESCGRNPMSVTSVRTPRGAVQLFCIGDLARWRADTFLTKEPETVEWIEAFEPGDVFWDIGANIGTYTLYAGLEESVRVLAFEPSAANYVLLNRNIEMNGLCGRVSAYCLAFTDHTAVSELLMQDTAFGGALSSFGEPVAFDGSRFEPRFRQGMIGFSVDDFIERFDVPFPNRLKIDVDGIEDKIIKGARRTLRDPRLKSVSIELDSRRPAYTDAVVADIEASGLAFRGKFHADMFEDSPYAGIYNYQFIRAAAEGQPSEAANLTIGQER